MTKQSRTRTLFALIALFAAALVPFSAPPTADAAPAYPDVLRTLQFEALLGGLNEFTIPTFLSTDSANNLYVADNGANQVLRYDADGVFVRAYGTGVSGTANGDIPEPRGVAVTGNTVYVVDGTNARVQLFNLSTGAAGGAFPLQGASDGYGIAVGPDGNLYVADNAEDRIEVYSAGGSFLRAFGSLGAGNGNFNLPLDVAFDSLGYLYVSDRANNRIQKFNRNGIFIRAFNGGISGMLPSGIHIDRADTLWVAATGVDRLFRFDQKGNLIGQTNAALNGIDNQLGGNEDPFSIAVIEPAGRQPAVYVLDQVLSYVSRFRSVAIPVAHTYEAKWGSTGTGNGQFSSPVSIATDKFGNVYVADFGNDRIQKFDRNGSFVQIISAPGTGSGQLDGPWSLAVDDQRNLLYVADRFNNRVQVFTTSGVFVRRWGSLGTGNGQFNSPSGIALDAAGYVYVADEANDRVQKFDANGTFIATWGISGTALGQLDAPVGIGVDSARGLVYVAEFFNSRVQVFTTTGTAVAIYTSSTSGPGQLSGPVGLALDGRGSLYVADRSNHRIVQFDTNGNYLAAFGALGTGDGQFSTPNWVAVDPTNGQLLIVELGNDRVQRFGNPNVKADRVGIFRPSNRTFFLRLTNTTGPADIQSNASAWTQSTDLAVAGDWNGDGIDTVGVYRPSNGTFYLTDNNRATGPHYTFAFGAPGDLPVVGDWDGDGCDGIGVYRPSQSQFYLKNVVEPGPADLVMTIGTAGDRPVAGDWNGDGQDTVGVYRPSVSRFFLTDQFVPFGSLTAGYNILLGNPNDVGFAGDWIEQGFSGIGVFRPTNGITFLKNALTSGFADVNMVYGIANDVILGGEWGVVPGESTPPATPSESAPEFGASGSREGVPGR